MEDYKKEFIEFMVDAHVLKFGEFTLKSGRKSPFFMNAGAYKYGSQLLKLGEFYARAIKHTYGLDFDVLFGPAYKGIPLAVSTVMAISKLYGRDIKYCANRKEIKGDRVLIIEDVTTSGASIEETVPILYEQADVDIVGLIVSLNRQEVGKGGQVSALEEIRQKYGFSASAIVTMEEVTRYLYNRPVDGKIIINDDIKKALDAYYAEYGIK